MNCPVCKRELAPTLSICLTCGAMMHDTVREEMETKVVKPPTVGPTVSDIPKFEPIKPWTPQPVRITAPRSTPVEVAKEKTPEKIEIPKERPHVKAAPPAPAASKPRPITGPLNRRDTNPTLVDFQPANPSVPEWRLQLQNSIRKRNGGAVSTPTSVAMTSVQSPTATVAVSTQPALHSSVSVVHNEKLTNAMRRIEDSKRTFGTAAAVAAARAKSKPPAVQNRQFPFDVVERTQVTKTKTALPMQPAEAPKPKLVSPLRIEKKKFDTNKLPAIPEPETPLPAQITNPHAIDEIETELSTKLSFDRLSFRNAVGSEDLLESDDLEQINEIDDLAPLSMRFGAAVFDLIIGSFVAGILLSPVLVSNSLPASIEGVVAIIGAVVGVIFLYLTATIAFLGRTFGMKLFSIEIIDADANELPTLHQAAVNSAVYILSLLLLGVGFLPALFNEERRAAHDILAGTLLIREY
ncbi:MAG: RDD family protein [Pyrinomonadaceae bacterium]